MSYFSRSGNTETIANTISKLIGGELFKIETKEKYDGDYSAVLDKAQQERRNNAHPKITTKVSNMGDYDIAFIGYPIWHGDTPMAILAFLESYDFSDKTVIPFCTYGSGGADSSFMSVAKSAAGANVLEGFSCRGADAGSVNSRIAEWLDKLKIFQE